MSPRASLFCYPELSSERAPWGRRPERSERCLAIPRHDRVEDVTPTLKERGLLFPCHPEAQAEGAPIVKEGISRYARNDKMSGKGLANAQHALRLPLILKDVQ